MESPFDKATLSGLDISLKAMSQRSNDLCLHRCMEDKDAPMMSCK